MVDRPGRRRLRRGRPRSRRLRPRRRLRRRPAHAGAAQRRHRPALRRRRPLLALRRRAALGAVPVRLARLVLADAGRAGARPPTSSATGPWRARRRSTRSPSTRGCSRPVAPTTAGCRPAPTPTRSPTAPTRASSRCSRPVATPGNRLAGVVAAWFFGANASKAPTYDPATGVTFDGVAPDGTVNHNSGAESTIHGLLTMLALDEHPAVRTIARTASVRYRLAPSVLEAEDATLSGNASAVEPESLWTGESLYGGTGYASLRDGSTATFTLPAQPGVAADAGRRPAPRHHAGRPRSPPPATRARQSCAPATSARPGDSAGPGALLPVTLPGTLAAGTRTVRATTTGGETRLDALMVQPLVTRLVLGGDGHGTALLRSAATTTQHTAGHRPRPGPRHRPVVRRPRPPARHAAGRRARRTRPHRPRRLHPGPPLTRRTPSARSPRRESDPMSHPHAEFPLGPFTPYDANPILRPQGDGWESVERLQPGRGRQGRQGRAALPRARRRHHQPRRPRDQRRRHPLRAAPGAGALADRALRGVRLRGPAGHRDRRHLLPDLHRLGPQERPALPGHLDRPVHLGEARADVPGLQHVPAAGQRRPGRTVEQGRRHPARRRSTAATSCTSARARSTTRGPTT